MHVLIIGAGALGVASAYHLAKAGHEVTVVDRDQVAAATTGFAAGILSCALPNPDDQRLTQYTIESLHDLPPDPMDGADAGPLLHHPGSHLLTNATAKPATDLMREGATALGIPHESQTPHEWQEAMQHRGIDTNADGLTDAISWPRDAWALSTSTTERLARHAKQHGARFRLNTKVERLHSDDQPGTRITGIHTTDDQTIRADVVLLAAGAWSRKLLAPHDLALPTQAFRTHAAILRVPRADRFPIIHDDAGGYYLRPESDQHLLVGDGTRTDPVDPDDVHNDAERSFIEDIATRVPQRFPDLEQARLQNAWCGVLTGVPDKRPLVGPHPETEGLHLCTGGNGFGFMRSFALGAAATARITGEDPDDLDAALIQRMDPSRFWPDPPTGFVVREGFALTE